MTDFETPDGRSVPAVTAEEMREVDRVAEAVGVGVLQMMEHAGRNLARAASEAAREYDAGRVTVLAGNGGNGGGGLCAARHLLNRDRDVAVLLDRPAGDLTGAAATQWAVLAAMGVEPADESALDAPGLVVDALVGYGLDGPLRGRAAELVARLGDAGAPVLSLDVPSGADATTGDRPGPAVEPERTLTLALPKAGLVNDAGRVTLADIGLPRVVYERAGVDGRVRPFGDGWRVRLARTDA